MNDEFITREYPSSQDFPRSRDYPVTKPEEQESEALADKKPSGKFVRFVKFVFVKNITLKVVALATAGLLWALIIGLG